MREFSGDANFEYMRLCGEDTITALNVLEGFENKRLMLINVKAGPEIWNALAATVNKFIDKKIRQLYIQNCQTDDIYFPKLFEQLGDRAELE